MFVIYMFENPNDYISNIKREVGISEEIATTIAESVADKIFDLILKKSEKSEEPVKAKPEPIMTSAVPEIPPTNLPMVEKGEVAHDARPLTPAGPPAKQSEAAREPSDGERVPHVEPTTPPSSSTPPQIKQEEVKAPLPDYRYQEGKDPYREPLG
jgi:hypothetical protein